MLFITALKTRVKLLFIVLFGLSLNACTLIGPDFEKPELGLDEQWLADYRETFKSGDATKWWEVFNDPVLNQLINLAHQQNLDLQTVAIRILEARAQLGIARGSLFPQSQTLETGLAFHKLSERSPNFDPSFDDPDFVAFDMGFDALWELDVWGRFRRGIESANAKLAVSAAEYDDMLVSLTAEVAVSYVQICAFKQRLQVALENAQIQKDSVRITEVRVREGISTELDMQQARALLHSTLALITRLQTGLRHAKNGLAVLLGRFPGQIDRFLDDQMTIPQASKAIVLDIPVNMLRRRPDVRKAEYNAAAQSALIGVAKADLLPRFTLRGALGLNSSSSGAIDIFDVFDMKSLAATIGPTVSWPILNYGRLKNNVRVQDARFEQAFMQYRQTVLTAVREVEDAMIAFVNSGRRVEHLQRGVQASGRSVDLALAQYRSGLEDYTRVLDSQQFLVQQQDALISGQGDYVKNIIAVYKALGGGWEIRENQNIFPQKALQRMQQRVDWEDFVNDEGS